MREGWKVTPFSRFLTPVRRKAAVDPEKTYKMVTLPLYGKGAKLRKVCLGSELGTSKFEVRTGDLMISKIDARKGSNSLLPPALDGAIVTADFLSYIVDESVIDKVFFDIIVRSPSFAELCDSISAGSTNRVRLEVSRFLDLTIDLPPIEEQQRIVDLIGSLDDVMEAAHIAAEAAVSGYQAMGVGLDGAGYMKARVEDVVSTAKAGGTPSRRVAEFYVGTVPWLKSGEVSSSEIYTTEEFISERAVRESSAWIAPSDSTVVAMYGANAGQIGRLRAPMSTNQAVLALVPDSTVVTASFLYHSMKSQSSALKAKARGAAQPNLSKGVVLQHEIVVAPLEKQQLITAAFDAADSMVIAVQEYATTLRTTRAQLLSVLLSGKHEIPESYDVDTAVQLDPAA